MFPSILISTLIACETAPKANPNITPSKSESASREEVSSTSPAEIPSDLQWNPSEFRGPSFMTEPLKDALYREDWKNALLLVSSDSAEAKVLSTWLAIQANQTKGAVHNYDVVAQYDQIPAYHRAFMLGSLQLSSGKLSAAQRHFALIPSDSHLKVQSQWLEATYLLNQSDAEEQQVQTTIQSLKTLASLEHPFSHGDDVIAALIDRSKGADSLYPLYRELWASYPYSKHTKNILGKLSALEKQDSKFKATPKDWSKRATQHMISWQWKTLIAELAPIVPTLKLDSAESCAVRYAYGRSHFKINAVTKASQLLPKVGNECKGLNDDVGAKAWYLIGKSYERKKKCGKRRPEPIKRYPRCTLSIQWRTMATLSRALAIKSLVI